MKSSLRTLVVAVLLAVTTSVGASGPATAAVSPSACQTAPGRTVVVDFTWLNGGVSVACDTSGATSAAVLEGRHHTLKRDTQGAVCEIDGQPNYCPRTLTPNGFWHLYWSDGKSGSWYSSSTSDGGLQLPPGGSVAWSWDKEDGSNATPQTTPPSFVASTPPPRSPATSVSKPTSNSAVQPKGNGGSGAGPGWSASPAPDASVSSDATASSSASASASAAASATASSTDVATPTEASALPPAQQKSHGLAWWVAPALIAVLAAAGGAIWFVRRRT